MLFPSNVHVERAGKKHHPSSVALFPCFLFRKGVVLRSGILLLHHTIVLHSRSSRCFLTMLKSTTTTRKRPSRVRFESFDEREESRFAIASKRDKSHRHFSTCYLPCVWFHSSFLSFWLEQAQCRAFQRLRLHVPTHQDIVQQSRQP